LTEKEHDRDDDQDDPDVDSIMHAERDNAFNDATGRLIPRTQVVSESRFFRAAVHDAVAALTSSVAVLGLVAIGILAVVLQTPGAALIASTCGTGVAAIVLAVLGQPPFKPNITIKRTDA